MEFIRRNRIKDATASTIRGGGGSYIDSSDIVIPETDPSKWENVEETNYIQPKNGKDVKINNVLVNNNLTSPNATINSLTSDEVETGSIMSGEARLSTATITDGTITTATITRGNITKAEINEGNITKAEITTGNIDTATISNLTVTGAAHFFELIIDKVKSVGGQMILSPAHAVIDKVGLEKVGTINAFRLYFKATDGDRLITNDFKSGDLIICQTFNAAEGTSYNVSNRFYWARIMGVSTTPNADGYYNISLRRSGEEFGKDGTWSATNCNTIPMQGDEIVVLGHTSDTSRQNAVIINSVGSQFLNPTYNGTTIQSPSIVTYKGVNTFSLNDKQDTIISPNINVFKGEFYSTDGKTVIQLMDEKLSLYATKDGLETAGIHIQDESITLDAAKTNVTGNLYINGTVLHQPTVITKDNVTQYAKQLGSQYLLDFTKSGMVVKFSLNFKQNLDNFTLLLPSIFPNTTYTDTAKDEARAYIGQTLTIYNSSGASLLINGATREEGSSTTTFSAFYLENGKAVSLTCKLLGYYGTEVIGWERTSQYTIA